MTTQVLVGVLNRAGFVETKEAILVTTGENENASTKNTYCGIYSLNGIYSLSIRRHSKPPRLDNLWNVGCLEVHPYKQDSWCFPQLLRRSYSGKSGKSALQ
jgi:hypothetical protein